MCNVLMLTLSTDTVFFVLKYIIQTPESIFITLCSLQTLPCLRNAPNNILLKEVSHDGLGQVVGLLRPVG